MKNLMDALYESVENLHGPAAAEALRNYRAPESEYEDIDGEAMWEARYGKPPFWQN